MKQKIERISTVGMSREDWLAERRNSLGGSDMGAVLGLNPWASPYSVWAEKTGKTTEKEETEAMRIGRDLEDYVAQRFTEASGLKVQRCNAILRNEDFSHLHANVDRMIVGQSAGLECKTASALNASKFSGGEFPGSYYAQCVSYLAVTECQRWYLAALVLGKGLSIFQMTRIVNDSCPEWCDSSVFVSEEEIQALGNAAKAFWEDYVEKDEAPPVDGIRATTDALGEIYERSNEEKHVDLTGVSGKIRMYLEAKKKVEEMEEIRDRYANEIKEYMGDAAGGSCELAKISWKTQSRKSFDAKRFAKDNPMLNIEKYYNYSTVRPFKVTEN